MVRCEGPADTEAAVDPRPWPPPVMRSPKRGVGPKAKHGGDGNEHNPSACLRQQAKHVGCGREHSLENS